MAVSVVVLSYIEAVGVTYFSKRRGWRVPMKVSERIVCYCAPAWVPAAVVMGIVTNWFISGQMDRWMTRWLITWGTWQSVGLLMLIGSVAMLWFEVLVWVGVRQVKYANKPGGEA